MTKLPQKIKQQIPFLPLFIDEVEDAKSVILAKQKKRKIIMKIGGVSLIIGSLLVDYLGILRLFSTGYSFIFFISYSIYGYENYLKKKDNKRFLSVFEENINTFITQSINNNWMFSTDEITFDKEDKKAGEIFTQKIKGLKKSFNITGEYLGHPLRLIKLRAALGGRQSSGLYRDNDLFHGYLLILKLKQNVDRKTVIAPKLTYRNLSNTGTQLFGLHQKGYVLQSNLETSFNQYFKVYTRKEETLPAILTPILQRQLAYFVKDQKIQAHLFFNADRLYITIRTGMETTIPSINDAFDVNKNSALFYEELKIIEAFLKRLEQGQLF